MVSRREGRGRDGEVEGTNGGSKKREGGDDRRENLRNEEGSVSTGMME